MEGTHAVSSRLGAGVVAKGRRKIWRRARGRHASLPRDRERLGRAKSTHVELHVHRGVLIRNVHRGGARQARLHGELHHRRVVGSAPPRGCFNARAGRVSRARGLVKMCPREGRGARAATALARCPRATKDLAAWLMVNPTRRSRSRTARAVRCALGAGHVGSRRSPRFARGFLRERFPRMV